MKPPEPLLAAMPGLAAVTPDTIEMIAAARRTDPTDPATVWAAATVQRWNVPHSTAWWLTCVASWPTPAAAIVAKANPAPSIPVLEQYDEAREKIDADTAARLQQIADDETAALLRRLGVNVMASAKDPKLRAALAELPLDEVWLAAASTFVNTNPKAITAAVGADDEREIGKALERAETKARRVLEAADAAAAAALKAIIGDADDLPNRTTRIGNALTTLRTRLDKHLRGILDPKGDRDPNEPTIGETTRKGTAPPSVARDVMNAAGGADILPDGTVAVDDAGRPLTDGKPGPPGHAVSKLTDTQFDTELRRIGRGLSTPDHVREAIAKYGGQDIPALARALVNQRLQFGQRLIWRRGNPPNPFDPHVPLEGVLHGSEDYERLSTAPFDRKTNGGVKSVGPWGKRNDGTYTGRWHPGDHAGCQCRWARTTVPTLELGGPEPSRTSEDLIVDEMLGGMFT